MNNLKLTQPLLIYASFGVFINKRETTILPIFSFQLVILLLTACTNQETVRAVFKSPAVEVLSVYGISDTDGEVMVSFSEVFQSIPEVGVVWAEKGNPTINDKSQSQKLLKEDTEYTFSIPDLQKNKTYYIRGYYKLNDTITYSKEIQFIQNYSNLWTKVPSPSLKSNEYISPDDVVATDYGNNFKCYKVNRLTNNSVLLAYYKYDGGWNPSFFGNRLDPNPAPRSMLYNPIYTQFESATKLLSLYGGGYQKLPQNRGEVYKRAVYILESDGAWEPYPGVDARTSTFGIGKLPYVLENVPNGKIWTIDFKILKWVSLGQVPTTKPARLITFDIGERVFLLVEPENPNDISREFYEYIVSENRWKRLADFAGEPRRSSSGITIGDRVYFGLGLSLKDLRPLRDIWEYNISTNKWTKKTEYPGIGTVNNFVVNDYNAYVGFGQQYKSSSVGGDDYKQANDLWQFTPY